MEHFNLLPHLTGIQMLGPDARAFAHAQFTTAFNQDTPPGWGLTAWCNPKGRVISTMLARIQKDVVELIAPSSLREVIAARLPIYSIGRKVEITSGLAVAGQLDRPPQPDSQIRTDEDRALVVNPADAQLDEDFVTHWKLRDICAGIVWLTPTQSEQHIPQALGLQEREGLNFTKGCYPGQEIVARVHYLGRAKQRLTGFRVDRSPDEDAHEASFDEGLFDDAGVSIGSVVSMAKRGHEVIGLTVVGIDSAGDQSVCLGNKAGRLCDPVDLC